MVCTKCIHEVNINELRTSNMTYRVLLFVAPFAVAILPFAYIRPGVIVVNRSDGLSFMSAAFKPGTKVLWFRTTRAIRRSDISLLRAIQADKL